MVPHFLFNHVNKQCYSVCSMQCATGVGPESSERACFQWILVIVVKPFSCSTQLSMKFILLINVKMPTIIGILTFISWINMTGFCDLNLIFPFILAVSVCMSTLKFMLS